MNLIGIDGLVCGRQPGGGKPQPDFVRLSLTLRWDEKHSPNESDIRLMCGHFRIGSALIKDGCFNYDVRIGDSESGGFQTGTVADAKQCILDSARNLGKLTPLDEPDRDEVLRNPLLEEVEKSLAKIAEEEWMAAPEPNPFPFGTPPDMRLVLNNDHRDRAIHALIATIKFMQRGQPTEAASFRLQAEDAMSKIGNAE